MPASEARIRANQANALQSTGPRTVEGKERSRANALTHGLTARVLRTPEEVEMVGPPTPPPSCQPGASPLARDWVVNEIQLLAIRVERAGLMELRLRERSAFRASVFWEGDQRSEVEALGSKIRRNSAEVVAKLEATPQGCRWLIERWAGLARIADSDLAWSPACEDLCSDLLGIPMELRGGSDFGPLDKDGRPIPPGRDQAGFARRNIDRLHEILGKLTEADDFDRATAKAGLTPDLGAAGLRLVRYEAELQRRLRWFHELLETMPEPESFEVEGEAPPEPAEEPRATQPAPSRQELRAAKVERRRLAIDRKLARRLE